MRKSRIHYVLMYATEAAAIATLVLWILTGRIEPLFGAVIFTVISATFHVLYLVSVVYEKLEDIERLLREVAREVKSSRAAAQGVEGAGEKGKKA